jgi:hypothetical protein
MTQLAASWTPCSPQRTNWLASAVTLLRPRWCSKWQGLAPEDVVRAAAGEVARIFPNSNNENYGEPRALS